MSNMEASNSLVRQLTSTLVSELAKNLDKVEGLTGDLIKKGKKTNLKVDWCKKVQLHSP